MDDYEKALFKQLEIKLDSLFININKSEKQVELLIDKLNEKDNMIIELRDIINKMHPWNTNPSRSDPCIFCGEPSHTDDCEYMKVLKLLESY